MAVSSETAIEEVVLTVPLLVRWLCCLIGFLLGDLERLYRSLLSPGTGLRREALNDPFMVGTEELDCIFDRV